MSDRPSAIRQRHRAAIARDKPACAICGEPIDYSLPYLHPREFVVDHIVPLIRSNDDSLANKQAAHRECNRDKGAKDFGKVVRRSGSLA